MDGNDVKALQALLEKLRDAGDDYVIVGVGVRGPNVDCPEGNAIATVRIGRDEQTSEALNLIDAISLARGKILRKQAAEKDKKAKEQAA